MEIKVEFCGEDGTWALLSYKGIDFGWMPFAWFCDCEMAEKVKMLLESK